MGRVVSVQANYYQVQLEPGSGAGSNDIAPAGEAAQLLCTRRARLKKIGQHVMVGDRVRIEEPDWSGGRGAIAEVLPRHTSLDRPPIANVNQILLVFALAEPSLEPYQLSRFLVKAESTGIDVCLCLSKSDLISPEQQQQWQTRLEGWGYPSLLLSTCTGEGLNQLQTALSQRITVVCGPSGVGKSSLINRLIPNAQLRVGQISGKLSRGRHTTRHVQLLEMPGGGLVADTPGFNQPDLTCTPTDLGTHFPEIQQRLSACQFNNCFHRDEPNCAVRGDWERYQHYLYFLAALQQPLLQHEAKIESNVKLKSKHAGQSRYEPKLAPKKYRQISRRQQQQSLQDLFRDGS
ncbi:GTPase RsgA [Neosynechococcus sphagnicola sy1]|uniref:Small ribosomal subunit biogenesis GTPase RsgA n=1 Tax=Neosynechococcus sphagnicola sy1 TaxID=1497020 RepID=A0A098TRA5_9CYAN|nr:GTPase RsgA [Neosynechococcus sphagnicola sy1]